MRKDGRPMPAPDEIRERIEKITPAEVEWREWHKEGND